jgi:predicted Zn-dependent protease
MFLRAQALLGLGQKAAAKKLLRDLLRRDPSNALAFDQPA